MIALRITFHLGLLRMSFHFETSYIMGIVMNSEHRNRT